ncbi:hypothetical protein AVEN_175486-1 [Araneus ventricosus]|uniref:RNase H type-1 domain-containing protein n=1 Tax=Araneus ventricosus TaxID=182803 RepID=A0A4Y2W0H1_ARAVE|nr:hypothetical protein AVEN_175486-1 [Araneus ventricosus]
MPEFFIHSKRFLLAITGLIDQLRRSAPPVTADAEFFSSIQRRFLLAIIRAYRTTDGLHLQLAAACWNLFIHSKTFSMDITGSEVLEHRVTGWTTRSCKRLLSHQTSLDDGGSNNAGTRLYTDGSKSPNGVGAAFCVTQDNNTTHKWSAKLTKDNTVFQAELLALNEAVKNAATLKTNLPVTIFVDNRASIQASSSPKTTNRTTRENFEILLENPHIKISWIKARAGYFGNKVADDLAKAESNDVQFDIKLPKCHAKNILRKDMMKQWQSEWDEEDTDRSTFNIFPKASLQSANWNRAYVLFFTGHCLFPSYVYRFHLANSPLCSCGEIGTPIHDATF